MKNQTISGWRAALRIAFLALFAAFSFVTLGTIQAYAQSDPMPAPTITISGKGKFHLTNAGTWALDLQGNTRELGQYRCTGELAFVPVNKAGAWVGNGVAVFSTASGALLVGDVTWQIDASGSGHATLTGAMRSSSATVPLFAAPAFTSRGNPTVAWATR